MIAIIGFYNTCITRLTGSIENPVIEVCNHLTFFNSFVKTTICVRAGIITVCVCQLCKAVLCCITVLPVIQNLLSFNLCCCFCIFLSLFLCLCRFSLCCFCFTSCSCFCLVSLCRIRRWSICTDQNLSNINGLYMIKVSVFEVNNIICIIGSIFDHSCISCLTIRIK